MFQNIKNEVVDVGTSIEVKAIAAYKSIIFGSDKRQASELAGD